MSNLNFNLKIQNTFNEFLDYMRSEKNASELTIDSYVSDFKIFISYFVENGIATDIQKIEVTDIRAYIVFLKKEKKYANETIRRKINSLRSFFNYLVDQDYLIKNPMRTIRAPKKEERLPVFFTEDEVAKLLGVAKRSEENFALRNYIFCKLIASTGIRRQEAIDADFDNIDFKDNIIKVKGKGNKERAIPIKQDFTEELFTYLQSRLPLKNHAVFINSAGNRINASAAHLIFTRLLEKSGLNNKGLSIHKLRHSYATSLVNRDTDIASVQKLLGHSDINTTTVYSHLNMTSLREDANKLPY